MREKGLNYSLNFGVSIPQLKNIAGKFSRNHELAEYCRKSKSREMNILATLLYPVDGFSSETADECVKNIPTTEIARQYCMNLFQYLPYAEEKAISWITHESVSIRTTGYLLLLRLLAKNTPVSKENERIFLSRVKDDSESDYFALKEASIDCLKRYGRRNKAYAEEALHCISDFEKSSDPAKKEYYEAVKFDLEFYLDIKSP